MCEILGLFKCFAPLQHDFQFPITNRDCQSGGYCKRVGTLYTTTMGWYYWYRNHQTIYLPYLKKQKIYIRDYNNIDEI